MSKEGETEIPSILWFRQDLRLSDQSALIAAAGEGAVIPIYVLDDEAPGDWRIGGAQRCRLPDDGRRRLNPRRSNPAKAGGLVSPG